MFERFTERARSVLVGAERLAKDLKSPAIRRSHVLVSLVDAAEEGSGSVAAVLDDAAIDRAGLRADLIASITATETALPEPATRMPFTAETKKALELSLREALSLGHNYIGREHLLLGVLRDMEGPLAGVVATTNLNYARAREIIAEQSPPSERGRRRRGGGRRVPRGQGATRGVEAVLERAFALAGNRRDATTGDLLVALLEKPGTHFTAALAGYQLPPVEAARLFVDKLVADKVPDGVDDAVKVDPRGSVVINDARVADAVKKIVGDGPVTPERLDEILRRLQG